MSTFRSYLLLAPVSQKVVIFSFFQYSAVLLLSIVALFPILGVTTKVEQIFAGTSQKQSNGAIMGYCSSVPPS